MRDFVEMLRNGGSGKEGLTTSARISVQSHLMAFAAEQSRLDRQVVEMSEYTTTGGKR